MPFSASYQLTNVNFIHASIFIIMIHMDDYITYLPVYLSSVMFYCTVSYPTSQYLILFYSIKLDSNLSYTYYTRHSDGSLLDKSTSTYS